MDSDFNKTKNIVRQELANFLGVETEDIEDDSSLTEDLHMKAKVIAVLKNITLNDYIEKALEEAVKKDKPTLDKMK